MSSMQSNDQRPYFVPGFGISRHIIFSHLNFFLGPYASCRSYSYHGREGYLISAPGPQLTKVFALPFSFSVIGRKSCSRIAADSDHRVRLKICNHSRTSMSRQQPKGCGGRVDRAPTITISTNQSICPKDGTRVIIEAGEFRSLAPHPSPPFPLWMLLRLRQSTGRTSCRKRLGGVKEVRSPLPCFRLQRLPALTSGMGGRSETSIGPGPLLTDGNGPEFYRVSVIYPNFVFENSKQAHMALFQTGVSTEMKIR